MSIERTRHTGTKIVRAMSPLTTEDVATDCIGTNLASIVVFGLAGHVWWQLGLLMGAANLIGGLLGSRMAVRYGSEFVRALLLLAVALLILRLGWSIIS